jgi:hypothetical protein
VHAFDGAVSITEEFRAAAARVQDPQLAGPELLPARLARACTRVLPIAGAGISMFTAPTMRIPVGASDETATTAERLQFTVAQGPCIDAHHTGQPITATEPVIARRWPIFHDLLITHTPVRGIVAVPLLDGLTGIGALDLYCHRSADVAAIDPTAIDPAATMAIAAQITTTTLACEFSNCLARFFHAIWHHVRTSVRRPWVNLGPSTQLRGLR